MEKIDNQVKKRKPNYQLLQDEKEAKLIKKLAKIENSLKQNADALSDIDNKKTECAKEKEKVLSNIAEIEKGGDKELFAQFNKIKNQKNEIARFSKELKEAEELLKNASKDSPGHKIDSPEVLNVKSRLAYLNVEISESNAKIVEYRKEAKREQSLRKDIEKLKSEEAKLVALVESGETSLKRNYAEELDVTRKQRVGFETDLKNFQNSENDEIGLLSDRVAVMSQEAGELSKQLATLQQADSGLPIVDSSDVAECKETIARCNRAHSESGEKLNQLEAELAEIKARTQQKAQQDGREQEYLKVLQDVELLNKSVVEIDAKNAALDAEFAKKTAAGERLQKSFDETTALITELANYAIWKENNRKFAEEMYPRSMEVAMSEYNDDKVAATEAAAAEMFKQAAVDLKSEIDEIRSSVNEQLGSKNLAEEKRKEKMDDAVKKMSDRLIEKHVNEQVASEENEIWKKHLKVIRQKRLAQIEAEIKRLSARYEDAKKTNSSEVNEAKEEYDRALEAKDSFCKAEVDDTLLVVKNLRKYFPVERSFFGRPLRYLKAVDDVSFLVKKGKTLGIVGESGCGKTTMGRTILRLHDITDGEAVFNGHHIENMKNLRSLRTEMQIIFQDPYSSLSPRMPVGEIIGEAVRAHKLVPASEYKDYIMSIMKSCGLQPHYFSRFPHEFSGGQRQRICIARALALNPKLVICDEPVSALDVSIQAQIINLLKDLQKKRNLTYVFISHDLSVVEHISDDVGVMYLGSLVESGPKESIFDNPMHPYTEALLSAVPIPDPNVKMNRIFLKGDIPSPSRPPKGCKFHTRCHKCMDVCRQIPPVYREYEKGHFVACHLYPQD